MLRTASVCPVMRVAEACGVAHMRFSSFILAVLAGVQVLPASAQAVPSTAGASKAPAVHPAGRPPDCPPVIIDYFYEPGCAECFRVQDEILPQIRERFDGLYALREHDVGLASNIVLMIRYQDKLGIAENESVCMILDYTHVLNGFAAIRERLLSRIDACVAERMEEDWLAPPPIVQPAVAEPRAVVARGRLAAFTMPAIAAAGLVDGINPCAISTLVFFTSVLAVSKVRGRRLVQMGVCFCLASFVTYTAIGFGLLRAIHACTLFPAVRTAADVATIAGLLVLAFLSFRDAYRFKLRGRADAVSLQLPAGLKAAIHRLLRRGVGTRSMVLGGLALGAAVTALESVCTGQMYVPALVLAVRSGQSPFEAAGCLLLYNALFILPLALSFVLVYRGFKTERLLRWTRKRVALSKTLLGSTFLALAALIALL